MDGLTLGAPARRILPCHPNHIFVSSHAIIVVVVVVVVVIVRSSTIPMAGQVVGRDVLA
jgi:hypothetical protein